ncbi:cyclopentanol dehydrogenase [Phyllobacterium trifolii]|uniref:Cyclopentanol dehydrogenase n=1 Tax=Phyllobacterium trifolii TaxID=300193 RepID=A0A839UI67_9HYPH|nr:SDR family oxidoreductase [Phyllobacterium trifolii]MBB3149473.1 cyclopentanol dehydrogenase [Phyllobacterium trifolii]
MADFTGKVVIVTGAGDGIGRAAAREFAEKDAKLVLIDIKGVEAIAEELRGKDCEVIAASMDVRDAAAWDSLVGDVLARFGTIDALVNNAGVAVPGDTAADVSEEVWDKIMDVNAKGVWLGMRAVLPTMISKKSGKICNVASTAAHIGLKNAAAYCASKGAVLALTRQAGVQYAPLNIQINSVSPGTTMTGLQRDVTEEQRAAFLPLTPIGRFAASEEVSAVIVFLCSTGSSFMTGADVSIDGGMVAL